MQCPKCNEQIVVLFGSREGICDKCGTHASMKHARSGTQYSLVGEQIPVDNILRGVKPAVPARQKYSTVRRDMVVKTITEEMLGFEPENEFRALSIHEVKQALNQAYELGQRNSIIPGKI